MLREDKELLLTLEDHSDDNGYYFYTDNTYSCKEWSNSESLSYWKIDNDKVYYKHDHSGRWWMMNKQSIYERLSSALFNVEVDRFLLDDV